MVLFSRSYYLVVFRGTGGYPLLFFPDFVYFVINAIFTNNIPEE